MITYLKGDLLKSSAQVLVNAVNTVGIMGKGIALQFKQKYPNMFIEYQKQCNQKTFDIGNLLLWKSSNKSILLFPTKKYWKDSSKIDYVEIGLQKFVNYYKKLEINSIAFPKLGCGNGGLDWNIVQPLMEKYLNPLDIDIYIYIDYYKELELKHDIAINMENGQLLNLN